MSDRHADVVVLRADPEGRIVRYVDAIGRLSNTAIGHHALIGGVAVMVRLMAVHRVTDDIDAVAWTSDGSVEEPIALLLAQGAAREGNGVVLGDVHVDLIAVGDYQSVDLPDDRDAAMFVVAHRYALETATHVTIVAKNEQGEAEVRVPVASPAALVAMKLRAIQTRTPAAAHKRASDAVDVYRLLVQHDRNSALATTLAGAPDGLGAWCATRARDVFVANVARTRGWLVGGAPDFAAITVDELRTVGSLFADVAES